MHSGPRPCSDVAPQAAKLLQFQRLVAGEILVHTAKHQPYSHAPPTGTLKPVNNALKIEGETPEANRFLRGFNRPMSLLPCRIAGEAPHVARRALVDTFGVPASLALAIWEATLAAQARGESRRGG